MQTFEKVNYRGWPNCYRLSNGILELIITADVGPRIIRFGFVGQDNEFAEFEDMMGQTGGDEWKIYGGHRLWHAPEIPGRTYFPDNTPVTGGLYTYYSAGRTNHRYRKRDRGISLSRCGQGASGSPADQP